MSSSISMEKHHRPFGSIPRHARRRLSGHEGIDYPPNANGICGRFADGVKNEQHNKGKLASCSASNQSRQMSMMGVECLLLHFPRE
jgi:hypothetical protein